jgi:hypothetical protein
VAFDFLDNKNKWYLSTTPPNSCILISRRQSVSSLRNNVPAYGLGAPIL